jgi:DNA-binding MarR family transcriptional regulator
MCFEFEAPWDHRSTRFEFEASTMGDMADEAPPPTSLDPAQLGAYFALIEVSSLLRHAIEQQLREAGDLSYVQFQLLARLGDRPDGSQRMTDLADGVVYSRSGLTYQAGLLEKAGLVTRGPAPDDERSVTVTITDAGRARLAQVFPGHIEVVHRMLFDPLSKTDVKALAALLEPVRDHMRATPPRSAAARRRR